jgi:hypothetical protein
MLEDEAVLFSSKVSKTRAGSCNRIAYPVRMTLRLRCMVHSEHIHALQLHVYLASLLSE